MKELTEDDIKLVKHIANKFMPQASYFRIEFDDLVGAGFVGLVKALKGFDPARNLKFSTYAYYCIEGSIRLMIRDYRQVSVSRSVKEVAARIHREQTELLSPHEVVDRYSCTLKTAKIALTYLDCRVTHLGATIVDDDSLTIEDALPAHADYTKPFAEEFIAALTPLQQGIVKYRMQSLTQCEIGAKLGVSQVHVGRNLKKIAAKLTEYLRGGERGERICSRLA